MKWGAGSRAASYSLAERRGAGTLSPMTFPRSSPLFAFSALALCSVLVAGCDRNDKALSAEDDTNPHFHAAAARVQERNFADAAKEYEEALRADPNVARAHYELGLLYGDHLNDPIAAMYHFEEYLRLRPGSDPGRRAPGARSRSRSRPRRGGPQLHHRRGRHALEDLQEILPREDQRGDREDQGGQSRHAPPRQAAQDRHRDPHSLIPSLQPPTQAFAP